MQPIQHFEHCPKCGTSVPPAINPLMCAACGFCFFFNPTVSAAAFVFDADGRVLLVRRAKEPAKGLFGIPGGFIDFGESAEVAVRREIREEVGIEVTELTYLTSHPNFYTYRGVTYPVCDLMFTAVAVNPDAVQSLDDVAGYEWRRPDEVKEEELAFESLRVGVRSLVDQFTLPARSHSGTMSVSPFLARIAVSPCCRSCRSPRITSTPPRTVAPWPRRTTTAS